MVELFVQVMEKLIQLRGAHNARINARFEKIHQPAYESLSKVHADYLQMFGHLCDMLSLSGNRGSIDQAALRDALNQFDDERRRWEHLRQELLALDSFVRRESIKLLSEPEVTFLKAVMNYFSSAHPPLFGRSTYSSILFYQLRDLIHACENSSVESRESIAERAQSLQGFCQDVMGTIRAAWEDAVRAYNLLRLDVTSRAS